MKSKLAALLQVILMLSVLGCAGMPGAPPTALTPPAGGIPPVPPGPPGTTNVVVPNNMNVNVYRHGRSLPEWLGLPLIAGAFQNLRYRLYQAAARMFPALATSNPEREPGAPILPVNDPANLSSPSPAVQTAAKIKQDEDQAAQKIKALNYLGSIGCGGCYPDVEDAFLAALDDCTEAVRYAAVMALKEAAGNPCTYCTHKSCCSPRIRKKLMEMSEVGDCLDCPGEPSERVRRVARLALANCGNKGLVAYADPLPENIEGPTQAPTPVTALPAQGMPTEAVGFQKSTSQVTTATHSEQLPSPEEIERLTRQWYTELDPQLSLDEKRDLLRKRMRTYLQSLNERDILMGDIMHEVQTQKKLITASAEVSVPESAPEFPVPAGAATVSVQTAGTESAKMAAQKTQQAVSQQPVSHLAVYEQTAGAAPLTSTPVEVRWERIVWLGTSPILAMEGRSKMEVLRRFLKRQGQGPDDSFKGELRAQVFPWTDTRTLAAGEKRALLENLPIGEISGVMEVEGGLELIRVLERRPLTDSSQNSEETLHFKKP